MTAAWQNIFVTRVKCTMDKAQWEQQILSVGKRNKYRQVVVVALLSDSMLRCLSKSHKTPPTGICNGVLLHKLLITKHDVLHISNSAPWTNINRKKKLMSSGSDKTLQPVSVFLAFWLFHHSSSTQQLLTELSITPQGLPQQLDVFLKFDASHFAVYNGRTLNHYRKKCLKCEVSV